MSERIRILQYGLGPIGSDMARHVMDLAGLELIGGLDVDPAKVGRDVGEVIGLGRPLGFGVAAKLKQVLARTDVDLVLHTTSSYFDQFKDQILEILATVAIVVNAIRRVREAASGLVTMRDLPIVTSW